MSKTDMDEILKSIDNVHYPSSSTYKVARLLSALRLLKHNELDAIYHLTESHCPGFRTSASLLYEKATQDSTHKVHPLLKENFTFQCSNTNIKKNVEDLLNKIEEMPKEWIIVQLTQSINVQNTLSFESNKEFINPLHITIFHCGQSKIQPISILLDTPKDGSGNTIELIEEIKSIMKERKELFNKRYPKQTAPNSFEVNVYMEFQVKFNERMKNVVKVIESNWLREWRTLFMGKFFNEENEKKVEEAIDDILKQFKITNISEKKKLLLKYMAKGDTLLDRVDMDRGISYCLPTLDNVAKFNFIRALRKAMSNKSKFSTVQRRHPVILLVDGALDTIPWEMIDILEDQPVSRMQSLHFTYALYKEYENEIVEGWKINVNPKRGGIIMNPSRDLIRMENRLTSFFNYWVPAWKCIKAKTPTSVEFIELLTSSDILSYNGHGNGFQYLRDYDLRKLRINAVVLLFGCNSVELESPGPQCERGGSHQSYVTACCPCVVGMLYPVTDCDTDIISTSFLSRWISSDNTQHWRNLNNINWLSGNTVIDVATDMPHTDRYSKRNIAHEPELLTALAKARKDGRQYITQAACVARGLPVKTIYL